MELELEAGGAAEEGDTTELRWKRLAGGADMLSSFGFGWLTGLDSDGVEDFIFLCE